MQITSSAKQTLERVFYIHCLVLFSNFKIQVLLNLNSEVNLINPVFINKLDFFLDKIDIKAKKINGLTLEVFKIVVVSFLL